MPAEMSKARYYECNFHIPKLQLLEVYPLSPFLENHSRINAIDVGANRGLWSEAFLKTFGAKTDAHLMLEPMPGNIAHLKQCCDAYLNDLVDGSVRIVEAAAGAAPGTVTIHYDRDVTTLASITNVSSEFGTTTVDLSNSLEVAETTVAHAMAEAGLEVAHLVKIDVEGYERQVMAGMQDLMAAGQIRNIYFEYGTHQTRNGESLKDFYDHLNRLGYTLYKPQRGINFFGLAPMPQYHPQFEPEERTVEMILATLDAPSAEYKGPRVIGAPLRPQAAPPLSKRILRRVFG